MVVPPTWVSSQFPVSTLNWYSPTGASSAIVTQSNEELLPYGAKISKSGLNEKVKPTSSGSNCQPVLLRMIYNVRLSGIENSFSANEVIVRFTAKLIPCITFTFCGSWCMDINGRGLLGILGVKILESFRE